MLGKVLEWCHDGEWTYTADAAIDPMGLPDASAYRVFRGGSWDSPAQYVRAVYYLWFYTY
jgi:formylglycine-generating enzyme required for sulfatase activity